MDINKKVSFTRDLYQTGPDTSTGLTDVEAELTGFPIKKLTLNKQTITGLNDSNLEMCTAQVTTCPITNLQSNNLCCPTNPPYNTCVHTSCECTNPWKSSCCTQAAAYCQTIHACGASKPCFSAPCNKL